jgi:hypothetical protein
LAISGGIDMHAKSGHGVDPYVNIPIPKSIKRLWKKWFYLRNNTDVPLPVFTGNHPISQPNWGHMVAKKDLGKLQPLREVVQ